MNIVVAVLIFTVIVVFHEFGHFLLAKKNKVGVTEFSVGMGPRLVTAAKTSSGMRLKLLCSQKTFESDPDWKGVTKYSWKLFPIGGSCAMVGEDMDDVSEGSFNGAGVWARFSIIFAGPFFNFIMAFVFAVIILGEAGVDLPKVTYVYAGQPGQEAGVQTGDVVKSINGKHITIAREITTYFQFHPMTGDPVDVVVERDGKDVSLTVDPSYNTHLFGFSYPSEAKSKPEVQAVSEGGGFEKAGIKVGDVIRSIEGQTVSNAGDLATVIEPYKSAGKTVTIEVERDGKTMSFQVTPTPYDTYTLGFVETDYTKVSPLQVLKYSVYEVKYWIETTVGSLGQLVAGKLSRDDVSGVVGVVDAVGGVIDQSMSMGMKAVIINVLYMAVLLSANLGVMNLLPLPALDGGRLVFILIEAIRGKPIDRNKEGFVHLIGFVLLMLLMIFVMYNDILKLIH